MTTRRYSDYQYTEPAAETPVVDNAVTPDTTPTKLFDVTCTIGSVYSGGQFSPRVAAFMLIADFGDGPDFQFPNEDGSIVHVSVATEKPQAQP